jgi:hypothetical protein
MNINQWAIKWGIPFAAVADLQKEMGLSDDINVVEKQGESDVQQLVRLEASKKGCRFWRNNIGAVHTDDGRFIRYGLANDTKAMNTNIKSSDLIGIRPVRIEPGHVGFLIGQFIAREVKHPGWTYKGTRRELAQLRFLNLISSMGGDARFATGEGTL